MRRSIKYLTVLLVLVITSGSILFAQNSNKLAPDTGGGSGNNNKKLIVCGSGDEQGTTTMGNTCDAGTNVCLNHPCY